MKVLYFQKFNNTQPGQTENLYIKTGRRLERAQCIGVESDQAVEFMPVQTCIGNVLVQIITENGEKQ